ncbi:hypothetical protein Ancab_039836 [Ancistrocladus abbreviatus]
MTAAAASSSYLLPIPIFNGENYEFWKIKMRTLLRSQNLWSCVEVGHNEPNSEESLSVEEKKKLEEDEVMDARALLFLQQGVTDALFPRISKANRAKEAWDILEHEFQGASKAGGSQFKSQEVVRYTRDQLLQLRELCVQVGSHYSERVKHDCHGCSTNLLPAEEEWSWDSLQEDRVFTGIFDSRLQGTTQSNRQDQISSQLAEEQISSEQMGEKAAVLTKVDVPLPAQTGNLSEEEPVLKTVKEILNMPGPEKFNILEGFLIDAGITSAKIMQGVVSLIFDKMILEPTLCPMYAELCSDLDQMLPPIPPEEPGERQFTFKRIIVNKCQMVFEGTDRSMAEERQMTDQDQELESMVRENLGKFRTIACIHFLGELLKRKLLPESIAHHVVQKLCGMDDSCPAGENVEAVCVFLNSVGKQLDETPASRRVNDKYFNQLKEFSTNPQLPPWVQLMIQGVLHLRANYWVPYEEQNRGYGYGYSRGRGGDRGRNLSSWNF